MDIEVAVSAAVSKQDLSQGAGTQPVTKACSPGTERLLRHADFERVYKLGKRHFSASMTPKDTESRRLSLEARRSALASPWAALSAAPLSGIE